MYLKIWYDEERMKKTYSLNEAQDFGFGTHQPAPATCSAFQTTDAQSMLEQFLAVSH